MCTQIWQNLWVIIKPVSLSSVSITYHYKINGQTFMAYKLDWQNLHLMHTSWLWNDGLFKNLRNSFIQDVLKFPHSKKPTEIKPIKMSNSKYYLKFNKMFAWRMLIYQFITKKGGFFPLNNWNALEKSWQLYLFVTCFALNLE